MWISDMLWSFDVLCDSTWGHGLVEIVGTEYYVQYLVDEVIDAAPPRLYLEAVSNEYLYDDAPLTPLQEASLERLGWSRPRTPCDPAEGCEMAHENWYAFASLERDSSVRHHLMELVMATVGVYGAGEGTEVNVSWDSSQGSKGSPYCD
jgi:hypothetical protein